MFPRFFTTNKTLGPLPTVLEMIYKLGRSTPVLGRIPHFPYFKEWVGVEMFWNSPMLWISVSPLDGLLTQIPKS